MDLASGQLLYFLMISLGFSIGIYFIFKTANPEYFSFKDLSTLVLPAVPIGWLGARLAHAVFEAPSLYQDDPWRIFSFWEGGFVFYGGLIAIFLWVLLISVVLNLSLFRIADLVTPWIELGYGIGRLGCFFAGCCFGRVCILNSGQSLFCPTGLFPTQLLASFMSFALVGLLLIARKAQFSIGSLLSFWLIGHGINRLVMEHFRGDFRGPLIADLTVGVWISWTLIALGASLFLIVRPFHRSEYENPADND